MEIKQIGRGRRTSDGRREPADAHFRKLGSTIPRHTRPPPKARAHSKSIARTKCG
jgi:hypothetical protein